MRASPLLFVACIGGAACHPAAPPAGRPPPVVAPAPVGSPPAAPSSAVSSSPPAASPATVLPFLEDDYPAARAEAIRRKVPLFVDVWAAWCHSCMSLKEVVFPDPKLLHLAGAFVWLSIDSEQASNEPFLARFPARSLPTLFVIDPGTEQARLKWIGAATADELAEVLGDARSDAAPKSRAGSPASNAHLEATALFAQGNRASAAEKHEDAVALYRKALAVGPKDWDRRPRAVEALSMRLADLNRATDAVNLAAQEAAGMPPGTSRVNVIVNAINASSALAPRSPARAAVPGLVALARSIAEDQAEPVLVDDRSVLYEAVVGVLATSNPTESVRLARKWAEVLEQAAAHAKDPETRRVWDSHRLEAYLVLEEPGRAVPMLEASEREDPSSYNPPARLARAHFALGQLDLARADVERALARCTVPRKLRIYMLKADILLATKDRVGARGALEAALTFARDTNVAPRFDGLVQAIERRARELGGK